MHFLILAFGFWSIFTISISAVPVHNVIPVTGGKTEAVNSDPQKRETKTEGGKTCVTIMEGVNGPTTVCGNKVSDQVDGLKTQKSESEMKAKSEESRASMPSTDNGSQHDNVDEYARSFLLLKKKLGLLSRPQLVAPQVYLLQPQSPLYPPQIHSQFSPMVQPQVISSYSTAMSCPYGPPHSSSIQCPYGPQHFDFYGRSAHDMGKTNEEASVSMHQLTTHSVPTTGNLQVQPLAQENAAPMAYTTQYLFGKPVQNAPSVQVIPSVSKIPVNLKCEIEPASSYDSQRSSGLWEQFFGNQHAPLPYTYGYQPLSAMSRKFNQFNGDYSQRSSDDDGTIPDQYGSYMVPLTEEELSKLEEARSKFSEELSQIKIDYHLDQMAKHAEELSKQLPKNVDIEEEEKLKNALQEHLKKVGKDDEMKLKVAEKRDGEKIGRKDDKN